MGAKYWSAQSPESEKCGNCDILFVDSEIARDQLYELHVHKCIEPDGIHPRILKKPADIKTGPFLFIYLRSWESGEVPADWKLASVIPIFKNGRRKDPGN